MSEKGICKLCGEEKELQLSHIIPSFVYKWIKNTSATGFLRSRVNPMVRKQDGLKEHLLCKTCEGNFNECETWFANNFFHKYVNEYVDDNFDIIPGVDAISYNEKLLKFAITLQWRSLLLQGDAVDNLSEEMKKIIEGVEESWRNYLLGKSDKTGQGYTYMVPMFNISTGTGEYTDVFHPQTNVYLLRSADLTIASNPSGTRLIVFTKPGPFAFITSLIPTRFDNMEECRIKKSGTYNFVVQLRDTFLNDFLYINRPKEVMSLGMDEKSKEKIIKSLKKNPDRVAQSVTATAHRADKVLQDKMKK